MARLGPIIAVFFSFIMTVFYLLLLSVGYEPLAQALTSNYGSTMSNVGGVSLVNNLWDVLYIYIPLIWNAGAVAFAVFYYMRGEQYVGGTPR